jgi:hypothetical protein
MNSERLRITRYSNGDFGVDWVIDGRPAFERCWKTEQEARRAAAERLPNCPVDPGVRDYRYPYA